MEWGRIDNKRRYYSQSVFLLPIALMLALVLVKPVPIVGGVADDFRYFTGAQCLNCLPTNHWETRFAIVWPTGIALKFFGQNLWSVMIFPVAATIAAVVLTFKLVEQQYGRKAGLIASCVLALTPVFSERSMRVGIDIIELVFLLGSVFILQRRKGHFWAGALMALAVLCRPTMLAALPMVGFLAWSQDPKAIKWFALGFALPLLSEAFAYLIAVGDPMYPWKLSLHHQQFSRAELDDFEYVRFMSRDVDLNESPLFNPNFIGGWTPLAGIKTHWTVQGIINLLASPECGLTLCAGIVFAALCWKQLDRLQIALIICAALFFGTLTYAFAVDPRGRMFMPIIVIAATLIGSLAAKLWIWPRRLVVLTFLALLVIVGVAQASRRVDYSADAEKADKLLALGPHLLTSNAQQRLALIRQTYSPGGRDLMEIDKRCPPRQQGRWLAQRDANLCIYAASQTVSEHRRIELTISPVTDWLAGHAGQIEVEPAARSYLEPLNVARDLPGLGSGRPYLLLYGTNSCRAWLARNGLPRGSLSLAEESLSSRVPFLGNEWSGELCLFRYKKKLSAAEVEAAISHANADRLYRLEPRTTFDLIPSAGPAFLHVGQVRICTL